MHEHATCIHRNFSCFELGDLEALRIEVNDSYVVTRVPRRMQLRAWVGVYSIRYTVHALSWWWLLFIDPYGRTVRYKIKPFFNFGFKPLLSLINLNLT